MSEFGKGFTYCIVLFLKHAERYTDISNFLDNPLGCLIWFNGASDHLYELEIPNQLPEKLRKRIAKWQSKCLDLGHGKHLNAERKLTEDDVIWAINEAQEILRSVDTFLGVKTAKGQFE